MKSLLSVQYSLLSSREEYLRVTKWSYWLWAQSESGVAFTGVPQAE